MIGLVRKSKAEEYIIYEWNSILYYIILYHYYYYIQEKRKEMWVVIISNSQFIDLNNLKLQVKINNLLCLFRSINLFMVKPRFIFFLHAEQKEKNVEKHMGAEFSLKKKDLWSLVYRTPSMIFLRDPEHTYDVIL